MHELDPDRATWHITWGTHAARLHGGDRPTVDRKENNPGDAFVDRDEKREHYEKNIARSKAVILTEAQRAHIERVIPGLCERGGWTYRTCSAGVEGDHAHVLLDVPRDVHGKQVRNLLKRWLTQSLETVWDKPECGAWWADGGSTKVVDNNAYLNRVHPYIENQRTTPPDSVHSEPERHFRGPRSG